MALFPLLAPDAGEPDYLVLEEALGQGAVEITEVCHRGSVPDLKWINKSPGKLLFIAQSFDGVQLGGFAGRIKAEKYSHPCGKEEGEQEGG
jgi:hypothetical protein